MTVNVSHNLDERLAALLARWNDYRQMGGFEQFVEFSVALNSLSEQLGRLRLPGLLRIAQGLENAALARFGDSTTHPLVEADLLALNRQVETLGAAITSARQPVGERRAEEGRATVGDPEWVRPRSVWLVTAANNELAASLESQLRHFGFRGQQLDWQQALPSVEAPMAVLFLSEGAPAMPAQLERIAAIRAAVPAGQLFYLGGEREMEPVVALMRAGIDVTIPREDVGAAVLARMLDLVQSREQERYRVLVVEDSKVAAAMVRRTLNEHNIDSEVVADPGKLLDVLPVFRPDLILMDMYMPRFTGVEATRVLRQVAGYQSVPIVYLSSESDIGMQVEALRLGGDQFLQKPVNPVVLAAVVRTKIERYRETVRSTRTDGLTGLLQIETGIDGGHRRARLVRQQYFGGHMRRRAGCRPLRVALVAGVELVRIEIGDAGDHHGGAVPFAQHVLVHQHGQAEAAQFSDPGAGAGIIFVVAGDEKHAVAGP